MSKYFLMIFLLFICLFHNGLFAVTEFKSDIKSSGGDYTSLSAWASAAVCNLTTVSTQVFSISGTTVTVISDGASVKGMTSNATGVCVHVSTVNNQILIKSISGTFVSGETVTNTATKAVTLSNGGDSAIVSAVCYSMTDTTAVNVNLGNAAYSSSTNYLKIYTPLSERHHGKWDDAKYNLVVSDADALKITNGSYTKIEGLQISLGGTTSSICAVHCMGAGSSYITIDKCIIKNTGSGVRLVGIGIEGGNNSGYYYNNIIYDFNTTNSYGMYKLSDYCYGYYRLYNNTICNCCIGFSFITNQSVVMAINNLIYNSTSVNWVDDGGGAIRWQDGTDYNASSDATNPNKGANSLVNQVFTFVDAAAKDFHLTYNDAGAKGYGTSSSIVTNSFADDVDGNTRQSPWEIGADDLPIAPTVTAITPATYDNLTSTTISIVGTGFYGDIGSNCVTRICFDDASATVITTYAVISDTVINNAVLPLEITKGTYNLIIRNSGGENSVSSTMLTVTTSALEPEITGVSLLTNYNDSASTLNITGANFFAAGVSKVSAVKLSTTPIETFLTGYTVLNDSTINNAVVPASTFPGTYNIKVSTLGGTGYYGTFVINPGIPVVTSIVPNIAHTGYNTPSITITGLNFFGGTGTPRVSSIKVQDMITPYYISSFVVASDSVISGVVVPLGYPLGTYDLKVTVSCSGRSVTNPIPSVKIVIASDPPTVTNIVPNILSNSTNATVALTGTTFFGGYSSNDVNKIEIDTSPVVTTITPSYNVTSDTQITNCMIPVSLKAGTYNIKVYTSAGPNTASVVPLIITTPVPVVSSVTPDTGVNTSAQTVTIYGTGFFGGTSSANILSTPTLNNGTIITILSSYSVVSDTEIVNCGIPNGLTSGMYNIFLANSGGANAPNAKYYPMLDSASSHVISAAGVTLTIPAGTFTGDTAVIVNKTVTDSTALTNANKVKYSGLKLNPNLGSSFWDLSSTVTEVSIYPVVSFGAGMYVDLALSFSDANITDSVIKNSLRPLILTGSRWELVSDPYTLDEVNNKIILSINHFSVYRLGQYLNAASNLDTLVVFPNPVDFTASARNSVKFTNLTSDPTIYIYTISGELVRVILPDISSLINDGVSGKAEWDGKNDGGFAVVRGIYLYLIKDGNGSKKVGKIAVK
ncbi:MAG: hypothetical protein A2497_00695 [Candidatus Firestonebacteria bacterium RifOxyC12_full_39_7]|nr:MAG: hypothetical protein A2497_00695 [Candidatus Firestonebacteria bacterium RifOxyC12_full_39_7]